MNYKKTLKEKFAVCRQFGGFFMQRMKGDMILRVASSLSYTSLIAIVPLFAIGLAIFSAFPVFVDAREQLQEILISNLAPNLGNEVSAYFKEFIGATAKLTTIGVVGIAITAILLLSTIENSLNFIFKVTKPRRLTTKLTLYWTVITLGPLILGAAISLRGYFNFVPTNNVLDKMLPNILTLFALVLLYVLVPNRKVHIVNALWGAVVAVVLMWILREGFGIMLAGSATYKTLYGALASIPLFLIWMYCVWAVVIFGAVVTSAIGDFKENQSDSIEMKKNKK